MKTEIFGTFGPACKERKVLKDMIHMGMTGMRLNLSHTTLDASEEYISAYRGVADEAGVRAQILIDMQGPELRVGELKAPVRLEDRQIICISSKQNENVDTDLEISECILKPADRIDEQTILVPREVIGTAEIGDEILFDDGKLLVQVIEKSICGKDGMTLKAEVVRGGTLREHKSIKIVGKNVKMQPLTFHDIENIKLAKEYGVTALMQPFVLSGADLRYVRKTLEAYGAEEIKIYAKIENRMGVENLSDILPEADVIIIARGDLGNDMPLWELPKVQKQIEEACKDAGKPYIVVTQMLASMEKSPVPTRAEVSDIYHAVYHGAWGVMVTGETAIGEYPVETIQYLANTAREAERGL